MIGIMTEGFIDTELYTYPFSVTMNPLTLADVSWLAEGRGIMAARRVKVKMLNYLHVLEHICRYQKDRIISEADILHSPRYYSRILWTIRKPRERSGM